MKYIDSEKITAKIDGIIDGLKCNCTPDPMGTTEECLAAAEIEALELVKSAIDEIKQEYPTPPGVEEESKKKGWIDYGLMVGDWVMNTHNQKPEQVCEILERMVMLDYNDLYDYDEIESIPLTEEILRKNGWVYNGEEEKFFPQTWVGGGLKLQGADDCGYRIVVTSDYDDEDTNSTPFILLYVNELQHALRLRRIKKEIEL